VSSGLSRSVDFQSVQHEESDSRCQYLRRRFIPSAPTREGSPVAGLLAPS